MSGCEYARKPGRRTRFQASALGRARLTCGADGDDLASDHRGPAAQDPQHAIVRLLDVAPRIVGRGYTVPRVQDVGPRVLLDEARGRGQLVLVHQRPDA